MGEWEQRS